MFYEIVFGLLVWEVGGEGDLYIGVVADLMYFGYFDRSLNLG